jgi:hypothetical protein
MFRMMSLDQNFAGLIAPASTSHHLKDKLSHAFSSPKVAAK